MIGYWYEKKRGHKHDFYYDILVLSAEIFSALKGKSWDSPNVNSEYIEISFPNWSFEWSQSHAATCSDIVEKHCHNVANRY